MLIMAIEMFTRLLYLVLGAGLISASFRLEAQLPDYQLLNKEAPSLGMNFQTGLKQIRSGQYEAGFASLASALSGLWRYQIQDLPAYSIALLRLADSNALPSSVASRVLEYSVYFAPHCSECAFAKGFYYLSPGHFSLAEAFLEFSRAFRLLDYDLMMLLCVKRFFWKGISELLKLCVFVLSILIIGRYFRALSHWFGHLFPADYKRLALPALVLVLLSPVFFGAPFWVVFCFPAIFCLVYAPARVKVVFMVLLFASGFCGFFEQKAKDVQIPLNKSALLSQLNVEIGVADGNDLEMLRRYADESGSPGLIIALAEAERRAGNAKRSSELLLGLVDDKDVGWIARNQLAALYLEFNDFNSAVSVLEGALALSQKSAEVYYNLSQAYSAVSRYDESDNAYRRAGEVDEKSVARFDMGKRLLGAEILPVRMLVPARVLEREIVPIRSWSLIFSSGKSVFAFFIFGLIILVGLGLRNKTRVCWYCGRIICPRCLAESQEPELCLPCYQVFYSGKAVDQRLKMEQRDIVRRYHRIMAGIGLGLNLILPGSGLIFEERLFSGLILMFFPLIFIASIVLKELAPGVLVPGMDLWTKWLIFGGGIYLMMSILGIFVYVKLTSVEG